jgi:TATA-binding protein-associated factor
MPGYLGTEKQFNEMYSKPILAARDTKATPKQQEIGIHLLHNFL